jgi:hypothetical protein
LTGSSASFADTSQSAGVPARHLTCLSNPSQYNPARHPDRGRLSRAVFTRGRDIPPYARPGARVHGRLLGVGMTVETAASTVSCFGRRQVHCSPVPHDRNAAW